MKRKLIAAIRHWQIPAVAAAVPVNTVLPAVTGTQKVGQTLSSTHGTWTNTPTGYTYQWYRDAVVIVGAIASTYLLTTSDFNTLVYCNVIASNASGPGIVASSNATSAILPIAPVNTIAPAISGTVQEGFTLICSTGTFTGQGTISYAYQWKVAGSNVGSNQNTYVPVSGDVGSTVTCTVTATNGGGSTNQISNTTSAVVIGIPVNTVAPAVTGTAKVGNTLSTTNGTWTKSPSGFAYQWQRDGVNIGSATSNTYALVSADYATVITCNVIATNAGGNSLPKASNGTSTILAANPVNTVAPAITGTEQEGNTLSCDNGTFTTQGTITGYTYQWKRAGVDIGSATANTYALVSADVGAVITCNVTATNDSGGSTAHISNSTGAIVIAVPANTVAPVVSGTAKVGQVLSCSTGTWSKSPTGYTYQWQRGGVDISSATANTYTLVSGDYNMLISCNVIASNAGGPGASQVSNSSSAVLSDDPINTVAPALSGTQQEGNTLTCSSGTWTSQATPTYTYQWKRAGVDIGGETNTTYALVSADVGVVITCNVTATNPGGGATSQISNNSSSILPSVPVNSVAPVISGTQNAGATLTSTTGTWTKTPTGYAYQWKSNGSNVGSNQNTYVVQESDVLLGITCTVTASNTGGSGTPTASNSLTINAKAVPTFVAKGIRIGGTGATAPALPVGLVANDIIVVVVETANETVTTPSGYTALTGFGAGTAGAIGSTGIFVFWKRHTGTESDPSIADPGDHQNAQCFGFRGCITSGSPWSNYVGGGTVTASTAFSASGPTTLTHNELAVIIACTGADASTSKFNTANNMAGTGLTNLVNQEDQSVSSGNGGGIALWTATKATPGAITTVSATINQATEVSWLIGSLIPA